MTGEEVKKVLKDRHMTITRLADEIGIPATSLCTALSGTGRFFPKYKKLISEYLDIPVSKEEVRDMRYKKECGVVIQTRVPLSVANLLKDIADAEGTTLSFAIRESILKGLELWQEEK